MATRVDRRTVDLSSYPDLVVIYLGMRVNTPRGLLTLARFGPRISASVAERPDGLLLHEPVIYSLFPPHVGMRQYWRDFQALEKWTRALPHKDWWVNFLRDSGGTASGMRHTSTGEAWKRSTMIFASPLAWEPSQGLQRLAEQCSQPDGVPTREGESAEPPLREQDLYSE